MAIKGLSNSTTKKLYELTEKEKKKDTTPKAKKPEGYDDSYGKKSDKLLDSYLQSEPFEFNINEDKLYQQYAHQYRTLGDRAMRDTIADAATKTGGYSSSYGISAGSQAYQSYLDKLNDIVPQLESNAYSRYTKERDEQKNKISLLSELDSREYDRYRDEMADYKDQRDYYRSVYEYDNDADLAMYKALSDYVMQVAEMENRSYTDERDYARDVYEYEKDYARDVYEYESDLAYEKEKDYLNRERDAYEYATDLAYKRERDAIDRRIDAYQYATDLEYKKNSDYLDRKREAYEYEKDRKSDIYELITEFIAALPEFGGSPAYENWFETLMKAYKNQ